MQMEFIDMQVGETMESARKRVRLSLTGTVTVLRRLLHPAGGFHAGCENDRSAQKQVAEICMGMRDAAREENLTKCLRILTTRAPVMFRQVVEAGDCNSIVTMVQSVMRGVLAGVRRPVLFDPIRPAEIPLENVPRRLPDLSRYIDLPWLVPDPVPVSVEAERNLIAYVATVVPDLVRNLNYPPVTYMVQGNRRVLVDLLFHVADQEARAPDGAVARVQNNVLWGSRFCVSAAYTIRQPSLHVDEQVSLYEMREDVRDRVLHDLLEAACARTVEARDVAYTHLRIKYPYVLMHAGRALREEVLGRGGFDDEEVPGSEDVRLYATAQNQIAIDRRSVKLPPDVDMEGNWRDVLAQRQQMFEQMAGESAENIRAALDQSMVRLLEPNVAACGPRMVLAVSLSIVLAHYNSVFPVPREGTPERAAYEAGEERYLAAVGCPPGTEEVMWRGAEENYDNTEYFAYTREQLSRPFYVNGGPACASTSIVGKLRARFAREDETTFELESNIPLVANLPVFLTDVSATRITESVIAAVRTLLRAPEDGFEHGSNATFKQFLGWRIHVLRNPFNPWGFGGSNPMLPGLVEMEGAETDCLYKSIITAMIIQEKNARGIRDADFVNREGGYGFWCTKSVKRKNGVIQTTWSASKVLDCWRKYVGDRFPDLLQMLDAFKGAQNGAELRFEMMPFDLNIFQANPAVFTAAVQYHLNVKKLRALKSKAAKLTAAAAKKNEEEALALELQMADLASSIDKDAMRYVKLAEYRANEVYLTGEFATNDLLRKVNILFIPGGNGEEVGHFVPIIDLAKFHEAMYFDVQKTTRGLCTMCEKIVDDLKSHKEICPCRDKSRDPADLCPHCGNRLKSEESVDLHRRMCFNRGTKCLKVITPVRPTVATAATMDLQHSTHLNGAKMLCADFECLLMPEIVDGERTGRLIHKAFMWGLTDGKTMEYESREDFRGNNALLGSSLIEACLEKTSVVHPTVCYLHNGKNYDFHILVQALTDLEHPGWKVDFIASGSNQKYSQICVSKQEKHTDIMGKEKIYERKVIFRDSCLLLLKPLDALLQSQWKSDRDSMVATVKCAEEYKLGAECELIQRKGILPYKWFTSEDVLKTPWVEFKKVYDEYNPEIFDCSEEDFNAYKPLLDYFDHAEKHFRRPELSVMDFYEFYLMLDTAGLFDVMSRTRAKYIETHGVDCLNYVGAPSLSWNAFKLSLAKKNEELKKENKEPIKIELMDDVDMHCLVNRMIRGGVSAVFNRHLTKSENSHILYVDVNNLYGYAMMQKLPSHGFHWLDAQELAELPEKLRRKDMWEDEDVFVHCDLEIPRELHEHFDIFPPAPEVCCPPGGKIPKLMQTLSPKIDYVCYGPLLRWYLENGVRITRIHSCIGFYKAYVMRDYIAMNAEMRRQATDPIIKDLMKLLNNSIYGKTYENVLKYMQHIFVTEEEVLARLVNGGNVHDIVHQGNCAMIVTVAPATVVYDKPRYLGASITELAKLVMYVFLYDQLIPFFGRENITLGMTDTDSFIFKVTLKPGENIWERLGAFNAKYDNMDFTKCPDEALQYAGVNHDKDGVIGRMKLETAPHFIQEFVALRPKVYAYITEAEHETVKAKGIPRKAQRQLRLEKYREILLGRDAGDVLNLGMQFVTKRHQTVHQELHKKCPDAADDKREWINDGLESHAWGYDPLPQDQDMGIDDIDEDVLLELLDVEEAKEKEGGEIDEALLDDLVAAEEDKEVDLGDSEDMGWLKNPLRVEVEEDKDGCIVLDNEEEPAEEEPAEEEASAGTPLVRLHNVLLEVPSEEHSSQPIAPLDSKVVLVQCTPEWEFGRPPPVKIDGEIHVISDNSDDEGN